MNILRPISIVACSLMLAGSAMAQLLPPPGAPAAPVIKPAKAKAKIIKPAAKKPPPTTPAANPQLPSSATAPTVTDDPNADVVFGVRSSLVGDYVEHAPGTAPDGSRVDTAFFTLDQRFVLARSG